MAIFAFPSNAPARAEWQLVSNTSKFESPADKSVQTSELPGARWHVSLSFPAQDPQPGRQLAAFLASLRGESGRFNLHDHTLPSPTGTITGNPVVSGAAQAGASINTIGWTGTLLAGDMIGVGNELKMVIADVTGPGVIQFEPPLRQSPLNGSAIITDKPTAVFKLTGDNQASWRVSDLRYGMAITCEEVF